MTTTSKHEDIVNAINIMSEILGSHEDTLALIVEILLNDGLLSPSEYDDLLQEIQRRAREEWHTSETTKTKATAKDKEMLRY